MVDELIKEYDKALNEGNLEALSVLGTKIQELRGAQPWEPAPENAEANSAEDLYADLLPIEQALMDGQRRTVHLHCGLVVTGKVTSSNLATFTILQEAKPRIYTIVRSSVEAIAKALDVEE